MLWEWKAVIHNDVGDLNLLLISDFSCLQVKKESSCKFKVKSNGDLISFNDCIRQNINKINPQGLNAGFQNGLELIICHSYLLWISVF